MPVVRTRGSVRRRPVARTRRAGTSVPCSPARVARFEGRLRGLEIYYASHPDSDDRAAAFDRFNARTGTWCRSPAQNRRLLRLVSGAREQAHREERSLTEGIVEKIFGALAPYLKIAAGGLGLLVVGAALVYVAGRTQPVRKVGGAVAGGTAPVRRAISGRIETREPRREAAFWKTAYKGTEEGREAMSRTRAQKVLPRPKGLGRPVRRAKVPA